MELEVILNKLYNKREEWFEDSKGRRFDDSWICKSPYSIVNGYAGHTKDLTLVRRHIAGPDINSLRTVMVGDFGETETVITHPETPLIVPRIRIGMEISAWQSVPDLVDTLLKSQGSLPHEIFDEIHQDAVPIPGMWDSITEANLKKKGEIKIPTESEVRIFGYTWRMSHTRHVFTHEITGEEVEFVTRYMYPIAA